MKPIFWNHRLETISALGVLFWGGFLLNPKVNSFEINKNYTEMAKHAPEELWGFIAVSVGIVGLIGLYFESKPLRRTGMVGAAAYRMFTLLFIGLQNHFTSTGTGDFLLWAVMAFLALYTIDHRLHKRKDDA